MKNKVIYRDLSVNRGHEGPSYDPYGVKEFTLAERYADGSSRITVLHYGLSCWLRVIEDHSSFSVYGAAEMEKEWERLTGIPVERLERYENRINGLPKRCPVCNSSRWKYGSGYVGEAIVFCGDCGDFAWSEPVTDEMIA